MSDSSCIHGRFTERHCEECEADARVHQHCKDTKKLETVLRELEGFARRNVERARKAVEDRHKRFKPYPSVESEQLRVAEARLHEAVRVHLVVRDRVREALS